MLIAPPWTCMLTRDVFAQQYGTGLAHIAHIAQLRRHCQLHLSASHSPLYAQRNCFHDINFTPSASYTQAVKTTMTPVSAAAADTTLLPFEGGYAIIVHVCCRCQHVPFVLTSFTLMLLVFLYASLLTPICLQIGVIDTQAVKATTTSASSATAADTTFLHFDGGYAIIAIVNSDLLCSLTLP